VRPAHDKRPVSSHPPSHSFLEAGRDGRLPHAGPVIVDLGDGRVPIVQQLRIAIYSKVAKEKTSRWLRVRADIRPRFSAMLNAAGAEVGGAGVMPMTLFSPPFYSLSKLNTTMLAKGIFAKDPASGLIRITVEAKDYLAREDGPAVRGPSAVPATHTRSNPYAGVLPPSALGAGAGAAGGGAGGGLGLGGSLGGGSGLGTGLGLGLGHVSSGKRGRSRSCRAVHVAHFSSGDGGDEAGLPAPEPRDGRTKAALFFRGGAKRGRA